jgi:predicted  nucleic acid-binding Zn-ribbon protein
MNQNILRLMELQNIDTRIHELDLSSHQFPEEMTAREAAISSAQAAVKAREEQLQQLQQEKKSLEQAITDAALALERSQGRLGSITTNREYDAVHTEIETNRQAAAGAKTRLDTMDADRASAEQALADVHAAMEQTKTENEPRIGELREKVAAIDGQRQKLLAERAAAVTQVSSQFLRAYEHIQKRRKDGSVLSYASVESRTCSRCHKVLEPQLANEVRQASRLSICQSCGSILVWKAVAEDAPLPGPSTTRPVPDTSPADAPAH